jgi:hypothetical protein
MGREKIRDVPYREIVNLVVEIKNEYIDIMSKFQKILSMIILKKEIFDILIYLPCFADNRERQYYSTLVSPTFYIVFRYLYVFYEEKSFANLEESIFYKKVIDYKI